MPALSFHQYGKTQVRLTQVIRDGSRHHVTEISAGILFRGEFEKSYTQARNAEVLPTDTMKNTVYVLARQQPIVSIEGFAIQLGEHFLARVPHLEEVEIQIEQRPWARVQDHNSAFIVAGEERRFTTVLISRNGQLITSGVRGIEILKTADSAFSGYLTDEFTTLPETRDRLLGTVLDAEWTYRPGVGDFNAAYERTRSVLLEAFSNHVSESVQHTLYDMACAAVASSDALAEVHLVMPNKHRLLVNLDRFGLDNPNQIFVPIDEPSGFIEARVSAETAV